MVLMNKNINSQTLTAISKSLWIDGLRKETKMNQFLQGIKEESNVSYTENHAKGYKTTFNPIVDMSFRLPSYRDGEEKLIVDFNDAVAYDLEYAFKFLFYARDARQGAGERKLFRTILKQQAENHPQRIKKLLHLIPVYGRWDDLWVLLDTPLKNDVVGLVNNQIQVDRFSARDGKPISLLGKWLPSEQASSKITKRYSHILRKGLMMSNKQYRKLLSGMRKYIDVVERKMSSNEWEDIDYEKVPSKASINYNSAFLRHDGSRRREFLEDVVRGEKKINSSTLYPYEIIEQLSIRNHSLGSPDRLAILAQWKNLPNVLESGESTIVVMDSSGSMFTRVGDTSAYNIALSLAAYCAERLPDSYKDKVITFSQTPQYIELNGDIVDKISRLKRYSEVDNTDIEKVFDLILDTAVKHALPQEELPKNVLIISDMEFDVARSAIYYNYRNNTYQEISEDTLFDTIRKKYRKYSYELPHLIFWNVASRTNTIPEIKENITLVSGFSQNMLKVALGGEYSPWDNLKKVLDSDRYKSIVVKE